MPYRNRCNNFFEFSKNIIEIIKNELKKAEKFIKIAIFQIHRKDIFDLLNDKLKEGIDIEIFTLPYDSIHNNQEEIIKRFNELKKNKAKLHFCKWNVGDPSRTTTAVGKWYSFHGKFIVTDKSAISMTSNFTETSEIDAILIFRDDKDKISFYCEKFYNLKKNFIIPNSGYDGEIRQSIINTEIEGVQDVFRLPKNIDANLFKKHWILHYPKEICPEEIKLENKLYIIPFDCRGVSVLQLIISKASEFVYLATESFTDPDFPKFLRKISLKNIEMKILCGAKSMDFTDRLQKNFRELLARNILIKTRDDDLHAKLLITDKHIAVGSVNLNKINLGFSPKSLYWRENTETITINDNKSIIKLAKDQFNAIFNDSIDVKIKLKEKIEKYASEMIRSTFGLKSVKSEVKSIIASIVLDKEIQIKKYLFNIGILISKITEFYKKSQVSKDHLILAVILSILSKKDSTYEQLSKKINEIDEDADINLLIQKLLKSGFIKKKKNYYMKMN